MIYDAIIIGQGLAGSLLAWQLLQQGWRVMVLDDGHCSSASRPAAGLVNPVSGQRLVKAPLTNDYLAAARALYDNLEQQLEQRFFHAKTMLRLFRHDNEQQAWEKRRHDPAYADYLGQRCGAHLHAQLQDDLGSFYQFQTGYLDTNTLLDSLITYLRGQHSYQHRTIGYDEIHIEPARLCIGELVTRRVIFCEGYKAMHNPWFSWLPFTPAKGEILTLKSTTALPDMIINAGKWLLPISDRIFKLGATYERECVDPQATESGKQELLQELHKIVEGPIDIELIGQHAGIRPCTRDRAPFIGTHPQQPGLSIFNGFGSKGALMIPFYARVFADALQHDTTLPEQVDIQRHWAHAG